MMIIIMIIIMMKSGAIISHIAGCIQPIQDSVGLFFRGERRTGGLISSPARFELYFADIYITNRVSHCLFI